MTDPLDTNDDWADLAREFNLDKPTAPPPAAEDAVEPHPGVPADEVAAEGEPEAEAAEEEVDDAEAPTGDAGAEGDGPGTGRKRRRRRRRRRKGDAAAPPVAEADADEAAEADEDAAAEAEADAVAEPVTELAGYTESENEDEGDGADAAPLAAEEDTASEVLRELIATWNVPSWGEIVDGLYRPH